MDYVIVRWRKSDLGRWRRTMTVASKHFYFMFICCTSSYFKFTSLVETAESYKRNVWNYVLLIYCYFDYSRVSY